MFRLRNKGIRPVRGSVQGDLYCHVAIETPVKLTARQKELLREFEAINQEDPGKHSPKAKGWFDKVKEFFGELVGRSQLAVDSCAGAIGGGAFRRRCSFDRVTRCDAGRVIASRPR